MPLVSLIAVYRPQPRTRSARGWERARGIGIPDWCLDGRNSDDARLWVKRLYRCRLCGKLHADEHSRLPQSQHGEPQVCDHCWTYRYRKVLGGLKMENVRQGPNWWRHFYEQANLVATAKIFMNELKYYQQGKRWRDGAWRTPLTGGRWPKQDAERATAEQVRSEAEPLP